MGLNELKATLEALELQPSRRLGQNFLCDPQMAAWIAGQLDAGPGDTVIEVGSGTGALTEHLVDAAGRLVIVERDDRLAGHLRQRFPTAEIHNEDAAKFDTRPYYAAQPVKMIGNLPYSAGGAILQNFLDEPTPVSRAVVTLQKEVCERLCAGPGSKDFGVLSLAIQVGWKPKLVKVLGPDLFHPRPKVSSAVVTLERRDRSELPVFDVTKFRSLVRRGFVQRRKQLKNALGVEGESWEGIAAVLKLPFTMRAEELSLEQWIRLTNLLDDRIPRERRETSVSEEIFDVVDESDEVIEQVPRAEVHAKGLRHRAVHIFIFNPKGELYLQKRTHLKDMHPGTWDSSAAGHLDTGEDYDEAAARELREELDIDAPLTCVGRMEASPETDWEFVGLYRGQWKGRVRPAPEEIAYGAFFGLEDVRAWIERRPQDFAPGFLRCFREMG